MGHRRGGSHHLSHEPAHRHDDAASGEADAANAPSSDHRHWRPDPPLVARPLKLLLAGLIAVFVGLAIVGQDGRSRRTAEAEVSIISIDIEPRIHPGIAEATVIRYSFDVAGQRYEGIAIKGWSLTTIREAKACYEPADPHNQILVQRAASCP